MAQHDMAEMHGMNREDTTSAHSMLMSSGTSLHLPMSRDGTGTSWQPDASPVYGYMIHVDQWSLMFHGDIFTRYVDQDIFKAGSRGGKKWDAPDMLMAMGQKMIGRKGLFHFSIMMSTDAIVAGGSGYPLLFQTGESWQGKPLVDRQHPHDLFTEVSASYAYALGQKSDIYVYAGYPGEPALGPVTFLHRPSARFMPDAPIGHHWEDATHITFGVATLGIRYGRFKIEGSSFTGREPDENRYNFDKPSFDSWSGRVSCNPSADWSLQISHGYLKSPEALHPDENVNRSTASAIYVHSFATNRYVAATALWGQNITTQLVSNAALLEGTLKIDKVAGYARCEWVEKTGEELNLDPALYRLNTAFPAGVLTVGASYDVVNVSHIVFALGGQLSIYHADATLKPLYGDSPMAIEIFLHIYPTLMTSM
jgi:hypothetical protein